MGKIRNLFPPDLAYREEFGQCGYSPRALRWISWDGTGGTWDLLFVGCKDGSVWVVEQGPDRPLKSRRLLSGTAEKDGDESTEAGIRAICPTWIDELLIVGRGDGTLELLQWAKAAPEASPEVVEHKTLHGWALNLPAVEGRDASKPRLRSISRLNRDWAYVSLGGADGTYLVDISAPDSDGKEHIAELARRLDGPEPLKLDDGEPVRELSFSCRVAPWTDSESCEDAPWLLIGERAQIYLWQGPPEAGGVPSTVCEVIDPWRSGECPSFVNDFSRWGDRTSQDRPGRFRGMFLATDRGVFLLTVRRDGTDHQAVRPQRLSLPGLGLVCTAITYAEARQTTASDDAETQLLRYLWVVDSRGDCHLFCDEDAPAADSVLPPLYPEGLPNFRSSGFSHLGSQALLAYSWIRDASEEDGEKRLFLAHARRDDRITIGQYEVTSAYDRDRDLRARARQLLSVGCHQCIREFIEELDRDRVFRGPDSSQQASDDETVAELAEFLAEDSRTRPVLEEFLCNPSARTSSALLLGPGSIDCDVCKSSSQASDEDDEERAKRACVALDLWTLTLLGVVHRSLDPGETERYCLGILRWLEDSRSRFLQRSAGSWSEEEIGRVKARYEDCLRMVRKWGLYGEANARRPSLVRPIEILEQQSLEGQQVDLLTYEALLFLRSVDLLTEDRWNEMAGNNAWGLAALSVSAPAPAGEEAGSELLIAVSWRWAGIELLRLTRSENGMPELTAIGVIGIEEVAGSRIFEPAEASSDERTSARPEARRDVRKMYGHSRIVLLAEHGGRTFLVMSAVQESGKDHTEKIYVYEVKPGGDAGEPVARRTADCPLEPRESAYSVLDLGGGQILVGLRGIERKPALRLITLDADLQITRSEDIKITSESLGVSASRQNRVWSMARAWRPRRRPRRPRSAPPGRRQGQEEPPHDVHDVVVGCGDGEVWRLAWPRQGRFEQSLFEQGEAGYVIEPVTRLGSPVQALAYRLEGDRSEDDRAKGVLCRVFAGGSDGSIVGLQRIEGRTPGESSFTSIWATWEDGGPVTQLSFIETPGAFSDDSESRYQPPTIFVAAVTRAGFCTLFDDRREVPRTPKEATGDGPHRVPFPGCRHGRFILGRAVSSAPGPKAFAALLLNASKAGIRLPGEGIKSACRCGSVTACDCPPDAFGRLGILLSATDRGTLHLQGLHLPNLTTVRRKAYRRLTDRWWAGSRNKEDLPQLKLGETVYGATPAVSLTLTRWLLEARYDESGVDVPISDEFPRRWQLPRHLRPLLDLRRAWHRLRSSEDDGSSLAVSIGQQLGIALRACRRFRDLKLYQEICEVVLRRANHALIRAGASEDTERHRRVQALYFEVFEAIERSLEFWLGRPDREESRARIVVAKNLVDGFTALAVLRRAALEQSAGKSREEAHFNRVLGKRIQGVGQLVFKRDPLVSLETLRATNLSMMRMCRRLVVEPVDGRCRLDRGWQPRPSLETESPQEVRWEVFSEFFDELVHAAVRALQSPGKLSDALAHEYARAFALAICACPSAAIRAVNRMTETRLISDPDSPEDLARKVEDQLRALNRLGLPVPGRVIHVFNLAVRGPVDEDELKQGSGEIGAQNAEDLACIGHVHSILGWFDQLSEALASDVRRIRDVLGRKREVLRAFERLEESSEGAAEPDLYAQSFDFWQSALGDRDSPTNRSRELLGPGPIRPELIEAVVRWGDWARARSEDLDARFENLEIFQPEYALFKASLRRLAHEAARFRESATVQKAVVAGILGHHLLEDLDEHVLELEEIAQNLNPGLVERYRKSGRGYPEKSESEAVDDEIATYLLRRAHLAESIPQSLRKLYGILDPEEHARKVNLGRLLSPYQGNDGAGWQVETDPVNKLPDLGHREFTLLELVLDELQQNQEKYYAPVSKGRGGGHPPWAWAYRDGTGRIQLDFAIGWDEDHFHRLNGLIAGKDQSPLAPFDRTAASSGTGVYLAKLATTVAGWSMRLLWGERKHREQQRDRPNLEPDTDARPDWVEIYGLKADPEAMAEIVKAMAKKYIPIFRVVLTRNGGVSRGDTRDTWFGEPA